MKPNGYIEMIPATVCGIPCQIGLTDYISVKGSFSHNAASDMDYYGYSEMDYELLDRKGYRASWLERKVSGRETDRIEEIITNYMSIR